MKSELAPSITRAASKRTFYTIRFLADRDRVADAYRAYAYFRWVDDVLDGETGSSVERSAFIQRQKSLLESCYQGKSIHDATIQEQMLIELVQHDGEKNSGLQSYLRNMMAVMAFDAGRRGQLISQRQLDEYTRLLATAVTEAMHYFIGHGCHSPHDSSRYLAVSAAHITHMLRDTFDDMQTGYVNIPHEVLSVNRITPQKVASPAYRTWVQSRVQLARSYFKSGKEYFREIENLRCRLAGCAYIARFEWLLDTIEREGFLLRPHYDERKNFGTGLQMSLDTLSSLVSRRGMSVPPQTVPVRKHY